MFDLEELPCLTELLLGVVVLVGEVVLLFLVGLELLVVPDDLEGEVLLLREVLTEPSLGAVVLVGELDLLFLGVAELPLDLVVDLVGSFTERLWLGELVLLLVLTLDPDGLLDVPG